jgi:hypothetical protein
MHVSSSHSQQLIRFALVNYDWRFQVVAMRDEAKETLENEIEVDAYILD